MSLPRLFIALPFLLLSVYSTAQSVQDKVRQFRKDHETALMDEYRQFLAIPNVSVDSVNIRKNAAFIVQMMKQRGIPATLLEGSSPGTSPAVFGEVKVPGAKKTLIFYAHYDGQPVNPKQWSEGLQPFVPVFITAPTEQGGKIITTYKSGDAIDPELAAVGAGQCRR